MYYESDLYHHGILGMKWGKRNGPPYPLDASDHSASEKKAKWRKSLDNSSSESDNKSQKKGLSEKQKRAIKIGAAVAATALVTYGAYKLSKSGKLDGYVDSGKSKVDELLGKKVGDSTLGKQSIDPFLNQNVTKSVAGIKRLAKQESLAETLKNVNPNKGDRSYNQNCTLCSVATFLRQQGYDVKAGSTGGKQQLLGGIVEECFKGASVLDGTATKFGRSRQDAAEMLVKRYGKDASGVVSVQWKGGNGGHAFNWSIKNGVVSFFDGQAGRDDSAVSSYWKLIDTNNSLTIARLDNAEINPEGIKKWLE